MQDSGRLALRKIPSSADFPLTTSAVRLRSARLTVVSVPLKVSRRATYCKVIGSFTGNWFTSNGPVPSAATWVRATVRRRVVTAAPGRWWQQPARRRRWKRRRHQARWRRQRLQWRRWRRWRRRWQPSRRQWRWDGNSGGDGDGSGSDGGAVAMAATAPAGRPERAEARFLRQDHQEYDDAIAKAQKDFQELQGKFESVLASKFDIHLGTAAAPCRVGTLPPSANASTSV